MDEKNKVEKDFKSKGTVSKKFTVPVLFWEEWKQDCAENFNDTYHLKMQHDHNFVKSMIGIADAYAEQIIELKEELAEIKERLEQYEEGNREVSENTVSTFGGK